MPTTSYCLAAKQNGLPDGAAIAVKHALPQLVAQHGNSGPARPVFVGRELASDERLDSQHTKVSSADACLAHRRRRVVDDEVDVAPEPGGRERDVNRRGPIAEGFPRRAVLTLLGEHALGRLADRENRAQPIGVRIGQRPDEDRVRQTEHGGTGADHERQRHDGGCGKCRRPAKYTHGVPEIANKGIDDRHPGHLVNLLELRARVPEGEPRFPLGVGGCPTARDQFFRVQINVGAHFLGALAFAGAPAPPSSEAHHFVSPRAASSGPSTRPIARASVSQRLVSASRCFRPRGVSR